MKSLSVYRETYEIAAKLALFKCDASDLQDAALAAVAARNEATSLHPANAPGTFSYMHGVAALRTVFLPIGGWETYFKAGVEGVQNKQLGLVILFQNVDFACRSQEPCPISQKGEAVKSLVDNPTGFLWPYMEEEASSNENRGVWFLCVACNGDEVRAELSRPREIRNGNFGTMAERIFIIQDDDWLTDPARIDTSDSENSADEYDVPVSKKK